MISKRQLNINDQGLVENFESEQYKRYSWMEYELFLQSSNSFPSRSLRFLGFHFPFLSFSLWS